MLVPFSSSLVCTTSHPARANGAGHQQPEAREGSGLSEFETPSEALELFFCSGPSPLSDRGCECWGLRVGLGRPWLEGLPVPLGVHWSPVMCLKAMRGGSEQCHTPLYLCPWVGFHLNCTLTHASVFKIQN